VKSHIGIVGIETADKTAVGVANGTLYEYERSDDNNQHDDTTSSGSSDEDERQGTYGGQHQGLHDDWCRITMNTAMIGRTNTGRTTETS
jgi:hypothetical protein